MLLLLAGCSTVNEDSAARPASDWVQTNAVSRPPVVPAPLPPATPAKIIPVPAPPVQPPPPKVSRPAPILTWTSLDRWVAEHKLTGPRRIANAPVTSYVVGSPRGKLILEIGSREATWSGVNLHLGFAPEIIDDQVFVHGLDLQKNLEPLLLGLTIPVGTNRILVLDPGHGGMNGGTVSVRDARPEKEFTLDWARRIKARLETNGWTVFLTRTNDLEVALSNRVSFAEARHASLFLSLHFNSSAPDRRQSGLETYCLTPTGMPSTLTRGYSDLILEHYPNNDFDEGNLLLAIKVHAALLRVSGEEDRGIRRARFMGVLQGQRRPAILIEGGFLSNLREAEKIESGRFREQLAGAVAEALQ